MRGATGVAAVLLVLLAGTPLAAAEEEDLGRVVRDLREEVKALRARVSELEVAVGRAIAGCPLDPRVTVAWTWASGDDDPDDGDRATFDPLYPFGHFYLGFMDRVGRSNINTPRIEIDTKPVEGWIVSLDYHMFWLDTSRDALYSAGGVPVRMATSSADDYVGSEIDLHFKVTVLERVKLWGGYSHFFAGKYLKDTGEDGDADWVFLQLTVDF